MVDRISLGNLTAALISTRLTPIKMVPSPAEAQAKTSAETTGTVKTSPPSPPADQIVLSSDGVSGISKSSPPDEMTGLLRGKALTEQANASLQKIQTYMMALKSNLTAMADENLSADARSQYQLQYQAIVTSISDEVKNGGPLLNSPDGISIAINEGQGSINISGQALGDIIQNNLAQTPQTAEQAIGTLIGKFTDTLHTISNIAADIDTGNGRINDQLAFLKAKRDAATPPDVKQNEIESGMTQQGVDAKSALQVAVASTDQISVVMGKLSSVANILTDQNLTADARVNYQNLYTSLRQEAFDFIRGSNDSGFNFLTNDQSTSITYNQFGASVNVPASNLTEQLNQLLPAQLQSKDDLQSFFANIGNATQQVRNTHDQLQGVLKTMTGGGIAPASEDEMAALLNGKAITDQASATLQTAQDYMMALKSNLTAMADENLSADARSQYQLQYQAIVSGISDVLKGGGVLLNNPDGLSISINGGQGSITVSSQMLSSLVQTNLGTAPQTAEQAITTFIGGFTETLHAISNAAANISTGGSRINDQIAFLQSKTKAITPPEVKAREIKAGMTQQGTDAKSAVKVAVAGLDQVTQALNKLQGIVSVLSDQNLTHDARINYQNLYTSLRQETFDFLQGSGDSGFNFLTNSQSTLITYNQRGASVNIPGGNLTSLLSNLLPTQIQSSADITTFFSNIGNVNQQISNTQTQLEHILKTLGSGTGRIR